MRIYIKAIFYALWSNSPNQHINTYARHLEQLQQDCATLRADVSNTNKFTHFVQQMYQRGLFEADFLEEWEARVDQCWDTRKSKFGDQFDIVTCASYCE